MNDTKPEFVEKRLKLQRKYIENVANESYERIEGCTEFDEKVWKDGFIKGYYAAQVELNQNKDEQEKCI